MQGEPLPAEDPAPSSGLSSFKLGNPSFEFVEFKFRIRRGQVSNSENKASNSGQVSNSDPSFRFGVSSPALGEPHREARQLVHEEAEHIYTYIYIYICCICLYMCLYLSLSLPIYIYIYIYIHILPEEVGREHHQEPERSRQDAHARRRRPGHMNSIVQYSISQYSNSLLFLY